MRAVTRPVLLSIEQTAGVELLYLTGRPEVAVAGTVALSYRLNVGGGVNVIVWVNVKVTFWVTCGAGAYEVLPD
jgi:hypothetical protein